MFHYPNDKVNAAQHKFFDGHTRCNRSDTWCHIRIFEFLVQT